MKDNTLRWLLFLSAAFTLFAALLIYTKLSIQAIKATSLNIPIITPPESLEDKIYALTDGIMPRNEVYAVIQCESGWDSNSISSTQDFGIWQINYATHILPGSITKEQALDPIESTKYAI